MNKGQIESKIRNTEREVLYYKRVYPRKPINDLIKKLRSYKRRLKQIA